MTSPYTLSLYLRPAGALHMYDVGSYLVVFPDLSSQFATPLAPHRDKGSSGLEYMRLEADVVQ